MFKKNTAVPGYPLGVFISVTTGEEVTTGTPTCTRLLDGTGGACANAAAYDATSGIWKIDLAASDLNADIVGLKADLSGCIPIHHTIKTVAKLVSDLIDAAAAPSAATVASQVRTELGTELGRIDVAISSRNATTPPTVAAIRTELEGTGTKLSTIHAKLPVAGIADAEDLDWFSFLMQDRLTPARAGYLDKLNVSGTLAHSDAANTYKADVSELATSAEISALHNFNPASDKVIVVANEDKTGYELTSGERTNIATSVWSATTRTLSSVGTLVADTAAAVWAAVSRTITGTVTVGTNNDKSGYSLQTAPPTTAQIRAEIDSNSGPLNSLYKRFFNKVVKNANDGTLITYEDDGSTIHKSQTFISTETTDTINKAT